MSTEYQRATTALNTAIAGSITAGALMDIMSKDSNRNYSNADDSLEAIADAVDAIVGVTDKQSSFLSGGAHPAFEDFFNTVANDADPDSSYWSVVENGGTVDVENDTASTPGFVKCEDDGNAGTDGIAKTRNKFMISRKGGITTVHLKAYLKFDWTANSANPSCGFGFIESDVDITDMDLIDDNTAEVATIGVKNNIVNAFSSDGSTTESSDLSSWATDNTWFTVEIRISSSDVKFYIDGTLRATHSTNVPDSTWYIVFGSTNRDNANREYTYVQWVQAWAE
jgi:hypothetical protein|tara:strand:- start:5297 stop:6142 length:846 start_codon:yes stop_codon:yes gene_type:complete